MFRKLLDRGEAGDNIGASVYVVSIVKKLSAAKFFVSLVQLRLTQKFVGEAYILTKDEGGRHTPFFA